MKPLSINEMTTYRWSFEEDVNNYKSLGVEAIGVWRQKLSDFGEDKGIELLAEAALAVSNLLWAGGFTGSDGRTHQDSIDDAADAIRLAAAMQADCLVVYTGARGGHTHNHARRLLNSALSKLVPLAEEAGVTLAIEPMHVGCAAEWTYLTSLDETLELIDSMDSGRVRLALDTYQMGHDESILANLPRIASRTAVVHLGDGREPPLGEQNRCRLGDGYVPLDQFITALSGAGYDGFYDVELMGEEIEAADYKELIAHSQRSFSELIGS